MQKKVYESPNHIQNLNSMRLNNKWCDVTIIVGDEKIRAHKNILAANLLYFDAALSSDSFQESKEGVITMECINASDLEAFVTYAYTGKITLTETNALGLLEVANYLGEVDIKEACIEFLEEHLRVEDAFQAYKFANAIECLSLKNAAKSRIYEDFKHCSQSIEYFNLDYENVKETLIDAEFNLIEPCQIFEGIMRWIMYDPDKRKINTTDLLVSIDLSMLTADYLIAFFYSSHENNYDQIKDIVFHYYHERVQMARWVPALMLLDCDNNGGYFQFYSFTKKKWTFIEDIPNFKEQIHSNVASLNEKLYFISSHYSNKNKKYHLQGLDPMTQKSTFYSSSVCLENAALCACDRFLYICGGFGPTSYSNQVLRFDTKTNSFDTLPSMMKKRCSAAAVLYDNCLYVLGGKNIEFDILRSVEKFDLFTKEWSVLAPMCKGRCKHAVAVLDGKFYACGGIIDFGNTVEVYDPVKNSWRLVASMHEKKNEPVVIAHEGKLIAMGGELIELYDPNKDQWEIDHEMSSGQLMEFRRGGLIPSSCLTDRYSYSV